MWRTYLKQLLLPSLVLVALLTLQACDQSNIAGSEADTAVARTELPANFSPFAIADVAEGTTDSYLIHKRPETKMIPFSNGYLIVDNDSWGPGELDCNPDNTGPLGSQWWDGNWNGHLQHLGKTFVEERLCWDNDLNGMVLPAYFKYIAANGDELHALLISGGEIGGVPEPWKGWGPSTIVGGTGRFENAQGWFTWYFGYPVPGEEHLKIFEGEISSVGSNK